MLVKSRKNCKSCNVVCFYYLIKTCLVYCISINTSNRICGSPSVFEFSHMALSLKTLPTPVVGKGWFLLRCDVIFGAGAGAMAH